MSGEAWNKNDDWKIGTSIKTINLIDKKTLKIDNMNMKTSNKKLQGRIVDTTLLSVEQINSMWAIFKKYYDSVSESAFKKDLSEKNYAILLVDKDDNSIKGFSTVQVLFHTLGTKKAQIIYSGDTILEKEYWGSKVLHNTFLKLILKLKLQRPFMPLYWFLISKGYKTFLLLAKNVKDYWPNMEGETPAFEKSLLQELCQKKFGDSWKPELGVLKFENCPGKLKGEIAPINERDLREPLIRFFVSKNPEHANGDELCCIGKIDIGTVQFFLVKTIKRILKIDLSTLVRAQ